MLTVSTLTLKQCRQRNATRKTWKTSLLESHGDEAERELRAERDDVGEVGAVAHVAVAAGEIRRVQRAVQLVERDLRHRRHVRHRLAQRCT